MGTATPWGISDNSIKITPGIMWYSTPSHGGFHLSPKKNILIPEYMREPKGWYEEDCAWSIVVCVFEHTAFKDDNIRINKAKSIFKDWYPNEYEQFYGVKLQENESFIRDQTIFNETHKNDYVVISARNSTNHVGYVECFATFGGERINDALETAQNFLVPQKEYSKRSVFGFVINPELHENISAF